MATTTSGLSSPGVGSGLDVNSIVSQLVSLERRPITALQTSAQRIQTQISGIGQMQSLTSALRDAAASLASTDAFESKAVKSSDTTAVVAAAAATGTPTVGSYVVGTTAVAAAQTTASAASDYLASTELAGAGTLTIGLGRWNDAQTAFTPKTGSTALDITVEAGDTLATLRDKINTANAGVSAAIVTDTTGARLTLRSTATGADNGFRVTVTDVDGNATDAAGLSRLAFNPPSTTRTTRTMAAADAVMTINGVEVRSSTDTFEEIGRAHV
jgi:flagellar hook-associated protein 2